MKMKIKSRLLFVASLLFTLFLSVLCGLGFIKPTFKVSANNATFEMVSGASVRLVADDPGIRFMASISKDEYDAVKNANGTFGMFILPNSYRETAEINEANAFGDNATYCWGSAVDGKTQIVQCTATELTQTSADGNTYYFVCALTNIKPQNYELDFFARAYYEVNGVRTWADLNEENVRSISYVAQKALGDVNYTPTEAGQKALVEYVTQFVEVGETEGEVTLSIADIEEYPTILVDGEEAEQELIETGVILSGISKGRHTATVEFDDGTTWDIPFVYADYVLRTEADINEWIDFVASQTSGITTENGKYVVVANNIVCGGDKLHADTTGGTVMGTTFDGYGHAITNFKTGDSSYGFMGKTMASNSVVKDIILECLENRSKTAGLFGTASTGTFENVYIYMKKHQRSGNSTAGQAYVLSGNINKATIKNCVVYDNSRDYNATATSNYDTYGMYAGALGWLNPTKETQINELSNVVVITTGHVISSYGNHAATDVNSVAYGKDLYKSATGYQYAATSANVSAVSTKDSTAQIAALKAFATNSENWTFDETTNTLYLLGNAVYTVK